MPVDDQEKLRTLARRMGNDYRAVARALVVSQATLARALAGLPVELGNITHMRTYADEALRGLGEAGQAVSRTG